MATASLYLMPKHRLWRIHLTSGVLADPPEISPYIWISSTVYIESCCVKSCCVYVQLLCLYIAAAARRCLFGPAHFTAYSTSRPVASRHRAFDIWCGVRGRMPYNIYVAELWRGATHYLLAQFLLTYYHRSGMAPAGAALLARYLLACLLSCCLLTY